jgi:GrpB-like predicted nucleotidyltransferase (UPF0157 family)
MSDMVKLPEFTAPLSDEEIAAAEVGPPRTFGGSVRIAPYDLRWPGRFKREAQRIREALGDQVLLLEHVGSTAVPGLPAKPIVDIDLRVPDSADEDAYVPQLTAAGYVLTVRERDWYEHRLFKGPDTDVNLHVFGKQTDEIERHLLLRDWLRAHPEDRDRYRDAKLELSQRTFRNVHEYSNAKTAVIVEILKRAGAT